MYAGIIECAKTYSEMSGISKREAERRIKDIIAVFKTELLNSEKEGIQFIDFITLHRVFRKSRIGRNPKDPSKVYQIPKRVVIRAELGKSFKKDLNN